MNKKLLLSLFSVLLLTLISCSEDNNSSFNRIILETDNITIWIGRTDSIAILSASDILTIESDDEKIASAHIKCNTIIINTHEESGHTILRLKDGSNNEVTIEVNVRTLYGGWKGVHISEFEHEIIINVEDEIIKEKIRQQLWESAARHVTSVYAFDSKTQKLTIISGTNDRTYTYGSFQFSSDKLIMNYNDRIESFKVILLGWRFIRLSQDFTDEFEKLYPDTGIRSVLVNSNLLFITL